MDGLLPNLEGQPGWVVVAVVLIGALAWVAVKVWARNADDGGGRAGLQAVDSATEFLTEKALEERGLRQDAERERDAAVTTRETALEDLKRIREDLERARQDLAECDRMAQEAARRAVEEERRRGSS